MESLRDSQFDLIEYRIPEMKHHYGPNVHLLSDFFLLSHLAKLCAPETLQPEINQLVTTIYLNLLKTVVNAEFPKVGAKIATRMKDAHPKEAFYEGPVIDPDVPVVSVNLARAGTLPSHICYNALNYFMNPSSVRQDHISIARRTDSRDRVTGSEVAGHKIGGSSDSAILLFPDPMGATGGTIVEAISLYGAEARPLKKIALHCIVTPEYLAKVTKEAPDLIIYSIRLDRGLSSSDVLKTPLGSEWAKERGLSDRHYIVPGGGGFGEILNNSYV